MPTVLLAAYLVGALGAVGVAWTPAAFRQAADLVESTITEQVRADEASAVLKQLKGEIAGLRKDFDRSSARLTRLFKDHAAEAAEMVAVLEELDTSWESSQRRVVELRFELRDSITEEEWSGLRGAAREPEDPVEPEQVEEPLAQPLQ